MNNKVLWLFIYSVAMALLESAVVVYMRRLYYPENPLELFPLRFLNQYDPILEISREVSTVLMILAVAFLAGYETWTRRFAAFVFVFGTWDLFYYVWLKVLMDWPQQWLEWDVLFLIPMIWLGPWICPALIALLFMVWGGWAMSTPREVCFTKRSTLVFVLGALFGLVAFMQPPLTVEPDALIDYVPGTFWWPLYGVSVSMMALAFGMTARAEELNVASK
ncbi:MAG: hypothetical protein AAF483_18840 [Planctomycetota bacterium]